MFELAPFALTAEYVEAILPLVDVKAHLSIEADETEFDDLLAIYSAAAVDQVERYCELAMGPKTGLVWKAEALPARLVLPVGPNAVPTGFAYLDGSGVGATADVATLRVASGGTVVPVAGESWPSDIGGGIELTFSAGYAEGECPPALKQAALLFVGHLFANREAVITGTISGEIPHGFRSLCSPFKRVVL